MLQGGKGKNHHIIWGELDSITDKELHPLGILVAKIKSYISFLQQESGFGG